MKKIVLFILLCLSIVLVGCTPPIIEEEEEQNLAFNELLDTLFVEMMGENPLDINFSLYHPEDYGLNEFEVEAYDFSPEAEAEYFEDFRSMKTRLEAFADDTLSKSQLLTKRVLIDYIDRQLAFDGYYYYGSNLGSYLGYQAQLPLILAEYRFDDANDIENYFDYLRVTQENFSGIVAFENEKIALNMGLTDIILDRVIDQCDKFVEAEEHYLIPVFNDKIDDLSFLTTEQKTTYKATNQQLIEEEFLPAYVYLSEECSKMKGTATHNGALANFEQGPAYYEIKFQEATGSNMTVLQAKNYLQSKLSSLMTAYQTSYEYYSSLYSMHLIGTKKLNDLLPYFIEQMEGEFPSLSASITYEIKEINEALQENASPAMYFISPVDDNRHEVIYINPLQLSDLDNALFQTLAHEGYPGHLYQNVYLKNTNLHNIRKTLNYTSYSEAWATYVENYVVGYVNQSAVRVFEFYDSATYLILGLVDIGINYEGWSMTRVGNYLRTYFDLTPEEVEDIFYDLTEVPTNYLQYYFSYYQLQDIKTEFKEKMGSSYTDLLFHTIFLETGPVSFDILREQYTNYGE